MNVKLTKDEIAAIVYAIKAELEELADQYPHLNPREAERLGLLPHAMGKLTAAKFTLMMPICERRKAGFSCWRCTLRDSCPDVRPQDDPKPFDADKLKASFTDRHPGCDRVRKCEGCPDIDTCDFVVGPEDIPRAYAAPSAGWAICQTCPSEKSCSRRLPCRNEKTRKKHLARKTREAAKACSLNCHKCPDAPTCLHRRTPGPYCRFTHMTCSVCPDKNSCQYGRTGSWLTDGQESTGGG